MAMKSKFGFFPSARRLFSNVNDTETERKPKIFRKLILGSVLGTYGYYQWEHYSRNMELAKKLDIPFYKVSQDRI